MQHEISYLTYFWERATQFFELKLLSGFLMVIVAFLYDPAMYSALVALFILILVDLVFGITASKTTGVEITSARFRRTPYKIGVYFTIIACGHLTEMALPGQLSFIDETLVGFLAATELLSILEKSGLMGFSVPQKLLNQLRDKVGEENNEKKKIQ